MARHSTIELTTRRVAKALRDERIRRGISMNKLAEAAGLSQQMVSYVERGMRNPTLDTLLRMSEAMNQNLGRILAKAISEVVK